MSAAPPSAPATPPAPDAPASRRRRARLAAHLLGLAPLAYLAWRGVDDGFGPNPVETITRVTGRSALVLLVATIACTPAATVLGLRGALAVRRTLGLYAFAWAAVHLGAFAGLDYGLDWALIRADALPRKPYILAGAASLAILAVLALTSTRAWQRRLGKGWARLHAAVYVAAVLAVVHYAWVVKALTGGPVLVGTVVLVLLALRVPVVRRAAARAVRRA